MNTNLGSNMGATAPTYPSKSSDPQNPASYLNSAYQAFKFNPGATQQALQAAGQAQQQGQPTDLRGLAALAAAHSQQFAKQAQQSAQAQGMPPSVLQQILQSSGIMNQLQPQQALAQQPPEGQGLGALQPEAASLPDAGGMATGGLVALARGGTSSLDDPEVDNDEFWDENTNAGPDIGGFLKRHVHMPTKQEFKDYVGLGGPSLEEQQKEYYKTTTPSPSKAREMAGAKPPAPPTEPPVDYGTSDMPVHRMVKGVGSLFGIDDLANKGDKLLDRILPTPSPAKQESNPPPPLTPEIPAGQANIKGMDEHGHTKNATAEVHPKATKIAKELQPTVIQDNSTVPNQDATTTDAPQMVETELRAAVKAQKPGTEAHNQAQAKLDEFYRRQDAANDTGDTSGYIHPATHQEGIASLAPGESMGVPNAGPTGIEGQLAQLEAMRGTYQMPPEIMEQLKHNVSSAKEDKWLMALTGLGAGFLGSNSPFKTQALGQGLMTGLGMYGRGAGEEDQAKAQMLAAQMAQSRAPYEAHTQAVNDLIRMQESRGKLMAGLKEKQFEYGMKDKLNQDRIKSNEQIADKRLAAAAAAAADKSERPLSQKELMDAASKAITAANGVQLAPGVHPDAEFYRKKEEAMRGVLGPYYDQVRAYMGVGASETNAAPMQSAQGNSQTRGFVTPAGFRPIGQ